MQAWEAWFRLVTSLIGFEIAFTIIGFCVYNMTKMLRKKLFGTEIPVETHARLQSQIRLLESKIHDLQLEESSRSEKLRREQPEDERGTEAVPAAVGKIRGDLVCAGCEC